MEDFYMTPYKEENHKKRNIVICISVLTVALVCGAGLAWYFSKYKYGNDEKVIKMPDNKLLSKVCTDIPDVKRLDCYPDAPVTENECINRGCCFTTRKNGVSFPPLNVPYCYYPENYAGYTVKDVAETPNHILIKLQKKQGSGFPKDIQNVNVLVSYIDDRSLRIKVCILLQINNFSKFYESYNLILLLRSLMQIISASKCQYHCTTKQKTLLILFTM